MTPEELKKLEETYQMCLQGGDSPTAMFYDGEWFIKGQLTQDQVKKLEKLAFRKR